MLILKRRSWSVIFFIREPVEVSSSRPDFTVLLQQYSFTLRVFCFLRFHFHVHLRYRFYLARIHITGAFYFPVPALHSPFVPVTALSHAHVLLAFSALSPRYPSSTWSRYPRTLYTLTVFNITCIPISCASCLFAFYTFVCNIEALCVHSCSLKGPIDGRL
jgi:hypothetical protein